MKKRNTSGNLQVLMKLLFEEALQICFKPSEDRIKKFKTWIEKANSARDASNLEAFPNQYDKAEELITFYTFAPLVLSRNRVGLTNRILSLAQVSPYEENVEEVSLEKLCEPPKRYLEWLRNEAKKHPVKYIREQAEKHRQNQPLESKTHVDAFIQTDKLMVFFEMKFISDISYNTTFNPCRNQLARLIDVGLKMNEKNGKEVLIVLSSPRNYFEKRARLYFYKISDYADPKLIQEDLPWRTVSEIQDNLLAVRWIALEDLIAALYKDFTHQDKKEALVFFTERNLVS